MIELEHSADRAPGHSVQRHVAHCGRPQLARACNLSPSASMTLRIVSKPGLRSPESAFVEAFPRQSRIAGNLCHPLCTSNVPERFGNECGISISLFKAGFQICRHLLRRPKVFGNVMLSGSNFLHSTYFKRLRAIRKALLISLAWVRLSPPARRIINSRPLCL